MSVIIVGFGPSLKDAKRGLEIDSFPNIVRCSWRINDRFTEIDNHCPGNPMDHGSRTDYLSVLALDHAQVINVGVKPEKATWIWDRPGGITIEKEKMLVSRMADYKGKVCREADKWIERYWEIAPPKYCAAFGKRSIMQTGEISAILAMEILSPKTLVLAGCDSFWGGERLHHDLVSSRRVVREAAKFHGVQVVPF